MNRILREPFVHFLILGALLFVGSALLGNRAERDTEIFVSTAEIERLAKIMASEQKRLPNDQEIAGLIAAHVREEALYREAVRLGLDDDDTILRRRLAQKMQFMINDLVEPNLPDDTKLREWFETNAARFAQPDTRSFSHVFFSPETHGDAIFAIAERELAVIKGGADWESLGDPFMLQRRFGELSEKDTSELFGSAFTNGVFALEGDGWQGPIGSAFGLHLVRIDDQVDGSQPSFESVRPRVAAAWLDDARRRENEQRIVDLVNKYEVTIEGLEQ